MPESDIAAFMTAAQRLETWCRDKALPVWADNVCDPSGGVYEYLHADGCGDNTGLRRVRVQARLAYVYAHAAHLGWYEAAKTISDHAWAYLIGEGCQGAEHIPGSGFKGCAHLLNPDGSLHDGQRDTYAQAFLILAGAWRWRAFQDKSALHIAQDTLAFLNTSASADNGGWYEGLPHCLPRRQNPHMHMFEALMALYDATLDPVYLAQAGDMLDLFKRVFFAPHSGVLLEFFDADWVPVKDGGPIEPGHMMEWVWLLREFSARSGEDVDTYADALFQGAIRQGYTASLGLLTDCVALSGTPMRQTYRTWPQTEYIKACVAQIRAGHIEVLPRLTAVIHKLFEIYFNVPLVGGWIDQLDVEGHRLDTRMPTSTFYHILSAASEVCALRTALDAPV